MTIPSSLIKELQKRGSRSKPMVPTTVRIPADLEEEIRDFCNANNIRLGVCIRELIAVGWEGIQAESD